MSDFTLEILEPSVNILEVETSFGTIVNNIEIERFGDFNIEIINTEKILVGDLPDIPMSKITGNFEVARIEGLDDYLDNYEFDCGTP